MDSSGSIFVDIFEIYRRYCDIWSRKEKENSRQELVQLLTLVELRKETCLVFDELLKLISHLDLSVDSCRFTCFYDFVYFMCRGRGQKNITIEKAIMAWNFVLKGRFRLLNEWCNFVEKHQRHNISEDTWQQVLAFSRCVHEDLEGYDPKGAWPVLIDDFVDHMHRVNQSNSCGNHRFSCKCGGDSRAQACMSDDGFRGLKLFSGTKRKAEVELSDSSPDNPMCVESLFISKRSRQTESPNKPTYWDIARNNEIEISKHGSPLGPILNSACAVEGSLAEGFAGLLSAGGCWQLDHKSRFPYT